MDASSTATSAAMPSRPWLRRFAKLLTASTLALIFIGGLVTSHGAGLAVPDWPTTYGQNMFTYPISEWTGGILYEHGHRLFASLVGALTIILALWLLLADRRLWVKLLGSTAVLLVIAQGVLGGVSVLMRLQWGTPEPVWFATLVFHAVLAQSFLILTIVLAYAWSEERRRRVALGDPGAGAPFTRWTVAITGLVFLQLIVAAAMRHRGAGIALMDFPTSAGYIIPPFNDAMLKAANAMRQAAVDKDPYLAFAEVTMGQIVIHFLHRLMAFIIAGAVAFLTYKAYKTQRANRPVLRGTYLLAGLVVVQFSLGVAAVLTLKEPITTSIHVVVGAATLGACALLVLRSLPVRLREPESARAEAVLNPASAS
jgi:cytochrome c oxidase assembly protein subunit 15